MTRALLFALALLSGCGLWIDASELPTPTEVPVDSGDSGEDECAGLVASHPTDGSYWRGKLLHLQWDRPVQPSQVSFEVTSYSGDEVALSMVAAAAEGRSHIYGPQGRGWPSPVSETGWLEHITAEVSWGCGSTVLEFDVSQDGDFAAEPISADTVLAGDLSTARVVGPLSTRFPAERLGSAFAVTFTGAWQSSKTPPDLVTTTTVDLGALDACSPRVRVPSSAISHDYAQITYNSIGHLLFIDGVPVRVDAFQTDFAMGFGGDPRIGNTVISIPVEDLEWEVPAAAGASQAQKLLCETEWCGPCKDLDGTCVRLVVEDVVLPESTLEPFQASDPCSMSELECDVCALGDG